MSKAKLYFREGGEEDRCYDLSYWLDVMSDEELNEIAVLLARPMPTDDFFWCQDDSEAYENDGQSCGKLNCSSYKPRNGKWGICKHFKPCYEAVGEPIILKADD